ncbi:DnaJ-domain-containing protein [Amylocystis lapponica]|nr:DnaJ-domain-containing protein [Amylocystis lapponica]
MFSYVLRSASTYFYQPPDEPQDELVPTTYRHIPWSSSDESTDSDDSDSAPIPSPPSSSSDPVSRSGSALQKNRAVIDEILSQNDLYQILGISRTSRIDKLSLRRAYLSRSKACHPDKFPDNPEATRAFQKVSVAYDVLSKPSSKRLYDNRSPSAGYDIFASRPFPQPEETFRNVVIGVFNDLLDGDFEMIRTMLRAVNDINPSLRLGEEGINSVLMTFQSIRERALTCRTCVLVLHTELSRVMEVQRAFRELSYFELRRRSCLTVQLARLTISLPIALDKALAGERLEDAYEEDENRDGVGGDRTVILNKRAYKLLRGLVVVLERTERMLG